MRDRFRRADTLIVFGAALALFAISATTFTARVTDISAWRVLEGAVPYRDFWTMYAPGSFGLLALAFAAFGRELIVSNLAGIATTAGAVALYYGLARTVAGPAAGAVAAGLVAVACFGTGYHNGFTSYPPALLCILAGTAHAASCCGRSGSRWAAGTGLLLGAATLFKHDVAGYAVIAITAAITIVRLTRRVTPIWTPAIIIAAVVAAILATAAVILTALGAAAPAWHDLVVFPLRDFRHVRGEYFPLLPRIGPTLIDTAQALVHWTVCNLPLLTYAAGALALWRRAGDRSAAQSLILLTALLVFWLHWTAAHVQLNTNAISLAAWSALVGLAGWQAIKRPIPVLARWVTAAGLIGWAGAFLAEPVYRAATEHRGQTQWIGLPGLRGLRATAAQAEWMRGLSEALAAADDPRAPLLLIGNRNDIMVFAEDVPYWLSPRRPATAFHELHPGVTDTPIVQARMIDQIRSGPLPVVVREYRFPDAMLDGAKASMRARVPVGSELLDAWIVEHYDAGPRFGAYEVMRRKPAPAPVR